LKKLQIEPMKLQSHMKISDERVLARLEGRDAEGHGAQRFIEQLNSRNARVAALPKRKEIE
jgi:polyphosphate kinase